MSKIFGRDYAYFYDIFYKNKNYRKECLFLEQIFKRFLRNKPRTILDIACGTGGHANRLAQMGYNVTGIDASEHMLNIARQKAQKESLKVLYQPMKMQNLNLKKKFDVIISMFSTIDYLTDYDILERFLKKVRMYLNTGGLFIFDFWNGLAVLNYHSLYKYKKIINKGFVIERRSKTRLYPMENICRVNYKVKVIDIDRKKKMEFNESHLIRYFFIFELKILLEKNGFKSVEMFPFLNINRRIMQTDWDITVIAKV